VLREALAPLAAAALVAAGCGGGPEAAEQTEPAVPGPDGGVLAVLAADPRLETLYRLITAEGQEHFVGYMSYFDWNHTLFAPTDEAFEALPDGVLDGILAGPPGELARLLDCHIVPDPPLTAAELPDEIDPIRCTWPVERDGGQIRVGPATILEADVPASNAVVHVVDAVLWEP
jgi:uncharacterized surface protein with fasciclin (FAS1) repeats